MSKDQEIMAQMQGGQQQPATIQQMLSNPTWQKRIESALPSHVTVDQMLSVSMNSIRNDKSGKLAQCNPQSLLGAIIKASQLGLRIDDGLGHAYLVPFKQEVNLIPGYKGYIDIIYRSDKVLDCVGHPVYENDFIEYDYGENYLRHAPAFGQDRGKLILAYFQVRTKNGGRLFEIVDQFVADKAKAQNPMKGIWNKYPAEMWVKTAVRRLFKFCPVSVELQQSIYDVQALDIAAENQESQNNGNIIDV
jgi:recombination protein RecT